MKKQLGSGNLQKGGIAAEIEILKQRREARKAKEDGIKKGSAPPSNPKAKDIDEKFLKLMNKKKAEIYKKQPSNYTSSNKSKIFVVVRKRPLSQKEKDNGEIDCVSVINPSIYVHECKIQVDGYTKYLDDHEFFFDNTFGENSNTEDIYKFSIKPMINLVLNGGIVTCFAYGQTGSGKTFTMKGIESMAIDELFANNKNEKYDFYLSFFEIYGGRLFDLLNNKTKLQVLDDKSGHVQIYGLTNILTESTEEMHKIIDAANSLRTTHNTECNETSSRSHAICNIVIKLHDEEEEYGKLSLVDLAGSERAQETKSNNRQRRAEGAEINKSLLALKECIRALEEKKGNPETHVPFRTSKLTHVLRDSFVSKSNKSRIIMISCIAPGYGSANHSINTLRYSDRLKEKTKAHFGGNYNNIAGRGLNAGDGIKKSSNNDNNNNNNFGNDDDDNNNDNNDDFGDNNDDVEMNDDNNNNTNNNNNNNNNNMNQKKNNNNNVKNNNNNNKNNNNIKNNNNNNKPTKSKPSNNNNNNNNKNNNNNNMDIDDSQSSNNDDWNYLKKTAKLGGKVLNDDYIRYHKLTDKLVEDEDDIINTHMNVIKDDAKYLNEEGNLITNIKGVGTEEDFQMDEYVEGLEKIIAGKLKIYGDLQKKIDRYKKHIKEEDELRKTIDPDLFDDDL